MKKYLILSLLLITGIPSFSGVSDHWKESRHVIFVRRRGVNTMHCRPVSL